MINFDKIKTRIIIAQSVGITPDEVRVIDEDRDDGATLYVLDDFKGHNLVFGCDSVPTILESRERVKELYLCGVEWDFDEDMGPI